LFKLPGLERKVRVALDWTLDLFFRRDIALLKGFVPGAGDRFAPREPELPSRVA
jgi:NADH dehydrogenase